MALQVQVSVATFALLQIFLSPFILEFIRKVFVEFCAEKSKAQLRNLLSAFITPVHAGIIE